ncbi:MAG: sensor histidine kinase [Chloroflexota bacterium]|nr:sensor histidine kinase [Chloroflexota bacterium]
MTEYSDSQSRWLGLKALSRRRQQEAVEARPFLIIVSLVILGLFLFTVMTRPADWSPWRLLLLFILMLVHGALYWLLPLVPEDNPWALLYLVVQGALAFSIVLVSQNPAMPMGLFLALVGVTLGLLTDKRLAAVTIVIILAVASYSTWLIRGLDSLPSWALFAAPMTLFVIVYVELYTRQAEARAEAQALLKELELAYAQLARYAVEVENLTLTAERQRMARELHDTLAQGLAGVILQLEAAKSHLASGGNQRAEEILDQAMGRARSTLADARRVISDLREESATSEDLAEAIEQEAIRFSQATGIPCHLDIRLAGQISEESCEHACRIVGEALANVAQHAQANEVWLTATDDDGNLQIVVRDDGIGFDTDPSAGRAGHYGLIGARERARLAAGTLQVESQPGEGTTLRLQVPLAT